MVSLGPTYAAVAKLVDALASGASGGNSVEVQVLSAAPRFYCITFVASFRESSTDLLRCIDLYLYLVS
jgi:hypothetical protein